MGNETTATKTCWVLDDEWEGYPRRFWSEGLRNAGFTIHAIYKSGEFVTEVEKMIGSRQSGDIALIDIALDAPMPSSIAAHHQCVQQALTQRGTPHAFHGQAVGIWLWDQRSRLRLPYAYVSSHPGLFLEQLALKSGDTEFGGDDALDASKGAALMVNRGQEGEIGSFVAGVCQRWSAANWVSTR